MATPPQKCADVLFVLDATSSMQCVFNAMIDRIEDIQFDLKTHWRKTAIRYGAVIYRDPVDYKEIPSVPVDAATQAELDKLMALDKQNRQNAQIEAGTYDEDREQELEQRRKKYDTTKYPMDKNVLIPFGTYEELATELLRVKCGAGNDEPEDWVGAIDLALNQNMTKWERGSKKLMVWITDANAHGRKFCGFENHQEEESKLEPYFEELARRDIHFIGINIQKSVLIKLPDGTEEWKDDPGCTQTLQILRRHYMAQPSHKSFVIQEFNLRYDPYLYNDDDLPAGLLNNFADTLRTTMTGAA